MADLRISDLTAKTTPPSDNDLVEIVAAGSNYKISAATLMGNYQQTVNMTNYQPAGAYLTTAMASNAGSNFVAATSPFSGTNASGTIASNGVSISVGNYLTTAMASNAGSNFVYSSASLNLTNVSATLGSNAISLSVAAPGAGGGAALQGSGTYTQNTGTIQFANSNGITFGLTNNQMTASHNALTTAMASNEPHIRAMIYSDATQTSGSLVLSGSGGISIASGNGSAIISFDGHHLDALLPSGNGYGTGFSSMTSGTVGINAVGALQMSQNGNNLSLSVPAQTAEPRVVSINGTSGSLSFNAGSNLSLSQNGNSFTYNVTGVLTTGMASDAGSNFIYASAGKNLTNISATLASNSISLSVGNYITTAMASNAGSNFAGLGETTGTTSGTDLKMTVDSNGVNISFPKWITTGALSDHQHVASASNGSFSFNTINFSNANNVTWGTSAGSIVTASVAAPGAAAEANWVTLGGNVAGNSSASGSTINWVGGNNITLSGTNGSQVTIIGGAGGGGVAIAASDTTWTNGTVEMFDAGGALTLNTSAGKVNFSVPATSQLSAVNGFYISTNASTISMGQPLMSEFNPYGQVGNVTNNSSIFGQSSIYFVPFDLQQPMYADRINFYNSIATTTNAASTITFQLSYTAGLYTRGAGTNSTRMETVWKGLAYVSLSAAATSVSMVHPDGFNAGAISYYTYNNASAASQITTYIRDILGGPKCFQIPISSNMTPGRYWLGFGMQSVHGTGTASWNFRISHHYKSITGMGYTPFGSTITSLASNNATARNHWEGAGSYSAQTAAMPSTVALNGTDIKFMTNLVMPVFDIRGYATNASNL